MIATLAEESRLRTSTWLKQGCNAFFSKRAISTPLSFWTNQDILRYIYCNNVEICSVYGDLVPAKKINSIDDDVEIKLTGCERTGCMFCGFGCHSEKGEGRFERMKRTHPKQYDYIMRENNGLNYKKVIDWINENGNLNIKY